MANGSVTSHKTLVLIMKSTLYSYCCVVAMAKQYASTVDELSNMDHILILCFFFFLVQFVNFSFLTLKFSFISLQSISVILNRLSGSFT